MDSLLAFDLILVNSAFSRENLLRSFNLDAKVSYLGINTELFKPLGYKKEKFVIGLGGIQPHKGINLAIEAISTIPLESRPNLMWVGNLADDDYLRDMKLLASNQGVSFEVHILISDLKLVELLNKASLLLYTSHLEPFGFAPLEANACGTPVVAVAEGGVRETVQSGVNGFLVPDRNPIALGEIVLKLLHDDQKAEQMSNNCVRSALNWSWDSAVERVEMHIYQNIMNVN